MNTGDLLIEMVSKDVDINFLGGRDEDGAIGGKKILGIIIVIFVKIL